MALLAFTRALRARKRLIKLAPHLFDPTVIRRDERRRREEAERYAAFAPALEKVYGPGSADEWMRRRQQQEAWSQPRLSAATRRAIERWSEERSAWLQAGSDALDNFALHAHHRLLPLDKIARLLDMAIRLGRAACGMPLDGAPEPEPENNSPQELSFEERIRKCYGD